jgi:hypothetical protein
MKFYFFSVIAWNTNEPLILPLTRAARKILEVGSAQQNPQYVETTYF